METFNSFVVVTDENTEQDYVYKSTTDVITLEKTLNELGSSRNSELVRKIQKDYDVKIDHVNEYYLLLVDVMNSDDYFHKTIGYPKNVDLIPNLGW